MERPRCCCRRILTTCAARGEGEGGRGEGEGEGGWGFTKLGFCFGCWNLEFGNVEILVGGGGG